MQLYVADYLGDTRHLSTEQHGAYLLLLMTMWRAGGSLPNDPTKLARIVGCSASKWAKISDDVMAFFEVDVDQIVSARLSKELEKASQKSIKRAEAGAKGGSAKSLKTHKADVANATVLPKHSSEPESERKREATASLSCGSAFETFWSAYPRKIGKPKARTAYEAALKRCTGPPDIMAGLAPWVAVWTDPKFIPHPTTWLTRDGWNDKPEPANVRPDHHSAKLAARQANLARAFSGAENASRARALDGDGLPLDCL